MLLNLVAGLRKKAMFKLAKSRPSFFFIFIVLCFPCFFYAQDFSCSNKFSLKNKKTKINTSKICPELMQEDLEELYKKVLLAHPNPFVFCSKEQWDKQYLQALKQCETPKTFFEFSKIAASWLSLLKDSHTSLDPDLTLWEFKKRHRLFPFLLKKIGSKFYTENFIDNVIPRNHEVIKIHNLTADSLHKLSLIFAINEGDSKNAKSHYATYLMGFIFNLCHDFDKSDSVSVKHINLNGDTLTTSLPTLSPKERRRYFKKNTWGEPPETEYSFVKISNDSQPLGILSIGTFSPNKRKEYEKNIHDFFIRVKKENVKNVLIDLRNNPGGYFYYVDAIMKYIDTTDVPRYKNIIAKRSFLDDYTNLSYFQKMILQFKCKYEKDPTLKADCNFLNSDFGHIDTLHELNNYSYNEKIKFKGSCYLAINGMSISASVDFASWFMKSNRGLVLGEPCMGPYTGTWGNPRITYLKNTKLAVVISTIRNNLTKNFVYSEIPIRPDIYIAPDINDHINNTDPIIDYLINEIKK